MLFVGIDVAKNKHDIAMIDSSGTVLLDHLRIPNNREGFFKLHQTLNDFQNGQQISISMEDTGIYGVNIQQFLQSQKYQVHTYNPLLIKEFAKSISLRKTKTDKKDALTIARKGFMDRGKKLFEVSPAMIELKQLTRHRSRLGRYQADLKIQYIRVLDLVFPELSTFLGSQNLHLNYIYTMLDAYPTAHQLASAHLTSLANLIAKASRGRVKKDRAIQIRELARQSIGMESTSLEIELKHLIESIRYYNFPIKETDKKIEDLMKEIQSPILTIPGISYRLGSIILSEIRSIHHFQTPAQLLAFSGLEPSVHQSGQYAGEGKMVKRGSSDLRWALTQAARLITVYSPTFKAYFSKKLGEGKHYNVALSHVAKKLVRVLFYLLKNNQDFDETKLA